MQLCPARTQTLPRCVQEVKNLLHQLPFRCFCHHLLARGAKATCLSCHRATWCNLHLRRTGWCHYNHPLPHLMPLVIPGTNTAETPALRWKANITGQTWQPGCWGAEPRNEPRCWNGDTSITPQIPSCAAKQKHNLRGTRDASSSVLQRPRCWHVRSCTPWQGNK